MKRESSLSSSLTQFQLMSMWNQELLMSESDENLLLFFDKNPSGGEKERNVAEAGINRGCCTILNNTYLSLKCLRGEMIFLFWCYCLSSLLDLAAFFLFYFIYVFNLHTIVQLKFCHWFWNFNYSWMYTYFSHFYYRNVLLLLLFSLFLV